MATPNNLFSAIFIVVSNILYALFICAVISGVLWYFYDESRHEYIYTVMACPISRDTSKCYKVRADYVESECHDEWGGFVAHCKSPQILEIYFDNGGYLTFGDCRYEKDIEPNIVCPATNDDSVWAFDILKPIRVRKDQ